jgi:hypothetical protein
MGTFVFIDLIMFLTSLVETEFSFKVGKGFLKL